MQREVRGQQSGGAKYPVGWCPVEMKQKKNKTPSQNSTVTNAKGAGTPVAAINLPNAAITPQEQIQKKINNLQKKLDEIEKLDVCPFLFCSPLQLKNSI